MMLNSFLHQQLSCRTNLVEGKALGILGWVCGQLGGELSPHHTWKCLFLLHIHGMISYSLGNELGMHHQKQR